MKKSYYCPKLEKTLRFLPDKIQYCCACAEGLSTTIEDFKNITLKQIEEKRQEYIKELKEGIIPSQCSGCLDIKERTEEKENFFQKLFKKKEKISYIIFDHYKQCDCNCIYCAQKVIYPDTTQNYEVLPFIKELYKKQALSKKDLVIEFQGGNISMLEEFEQLMEEFEKHQIKEIHFLTNGIKYMQTIERIAEKTKTYVCISLDAGTQETFKTLKNVDKFIQTTENIRKLTDNPNINLKLKYIVVKGINDNKEEIEKFLEFAKSLSKTDSIMFEIDYRDILMSEKKELPMHYSELIKYAENYCNENNLIFWMSDFSKSYLK